MTLKNGITCFLVLFPLAVGTSLMSYAATFLISSYFSRTLEIPYFPDAMTLAFISICVMMVAILAVLLFMFRPVQTEFSLSGRKIWYSTLFIVLGVSSIIIATFSGVYMDKLEIMSVSNIIGHIPVELFIFMAILNVGIIYFSAWALWLAGRNSPSEFRGQYTN